jgi:hypothetical protein
MADVSLDEIFWRQQGEPRVEDGARRGKHRRTIGVPGIGLIPIRTTTNSGKRRRTSWFHEESKDLQDTFEDDV